MTEASPLVPVAQARRAAVLAALSATSAFTLSLALVLWAVSRPRTSADGMVTVAFAAVGALALARLGIICLLSASDLWSQARADRDTAGPGRPVTPSAQADPRTTVPTAGERRRRSEGATGARVRAASIFVALAAFSGLGAASADAVTSTTSVAVSTASVADPLAPPHDAAIGVGAPDFTTSSDAPAVPSGADRASTSSPDVSPPSSTAAASTPEPALGLLMCDTASSESVLDLGPSSAAAVSSAANSANPAPEPGWTPPASAPDARLCRLVTSGMTSPGTLTPSDGLHVVLRGETLWSIAAAHLPGDAEPEQIVRSVTEWISANPAVSECPDVLHPGDVLVSPTAANRHAAQAAGTQDAEVTQP